MSTRACSSSHHTRPSRAAMCLALLAGAGATTLAEAGVKNWNIADGLWSTPANWTPFGVPTAGDVIFIGNTLAAANGAVTLGADTTVASIQITDGMTLHNSTSKLTCTGLMSLAGKNIVQLTEYPSRLVVTEASVGADVVTDAINVADGAVVELDQALLQVNGTLSLFETSRLIGRGTIFFFGDTTPVFKNDGRYEVGPGFSSIVQLGNGLIDLDGDIPGQVSLDLTKATLFPTYLPPELRITGMGLADPMDDQIHFAAGAELMMELDEPWTLGPAGVIKAYVPNDQLGPSRVQGAHVNVQGSIDVEGADDGALIFDATSTWASSASANIDPGCLLWLFGATVNGGSFTLGEASVLRFSTETSINGGTFSTAGPTLDDGLIYFSGLTTYAGTISISGYAANGGDAIVSAPATINGGSFVPSYMGEAHWDIKNHLTLNVENFGTNNITAASFNISETLQGKLTVQLPDPNATWRSIGSMNLGGLGQLLSTRIAGNRVLVDGQTNITNAVQITAPLDLRGVFGFTNNTSRLRSTNATQVHPSANFSGGGRVEVASSGSLLLHDGANLGFTDLMNESDMEVAIGPGVATVDQLTLLPTSAWTVELGGYNAGDQYDQLYANGAAVTLAGELHVRHIDLGDGVFSPTIGDVFTVLIAPPNHLSGVFANGPVSHIPGTTFLWSIGYDTLEVADVVTLKLIDVVPCKADLNGDGMVEAADLAILLGEWGANEGSIADFNGNGLVAGEDLAELLGAWGLCFVN